MNRERARELLPIIEAFANGEDIQYKSEDSEWEDDPNFSLSDNYKCFEYRIKPKPREFWIRPSPPAEKGLDDILTGRPMSCVNGSEDYIHVREVL